jgi:hypothetical protein
LKEIYASIERLGQTDLKHSNSFRMKNYYFLSVTVPTSEVETKNIYLETRLNYIVWLIKSKFNELFSFIEGIDQFVSTTGFDIEGNQILKIISQRHWISNSILQTKIIDDYFTI